MFRCHRKNKLMGLCFFSFGLGMLLAFLIPSWGIIIALISIGFGLWQYFNS